MIDVLRNSFSAIFRAFWISKLNILILLCKNISMILLGVFKMSQKASRERNTEGSWLLALLAGFILGMWFGSKK